MTTAIELIRVGEDEIHGLRTEDGQAWVSVRRLCDVLQLDPEGQRQKLRDPVRSPWAVACMTKATAADGRDYETFCLHVDSVPMWLATVDASRCAEQAKVVRFQREAARVLADWAYGRRIAQAPESYEALMARALKAADERVKLLEAKVVEDAPKVEGWHRLMDAEGLIPIMDAGKAMGVQPLLFHRWMVSAGHIYKRHGDVLARQDHLSFGRMKQVTTTVTVRTPTGETEERKRIYAKLTSHGLAYFTERIEQFRAAATHHHRRLPAAFEAPMLPGAHP